MWHSLPARRPPCPRAVVLNIGAIPAAGAGSAPRATARKGRTEDQTSLLWQARRMVFGLVPEASNGPVSPQLGDAGSPRPNEFSVCQSREQRDTGPRTPLHASEGRPRARYDKKEHNKCSQVEYDSC